MPLLKSLYLDKVKLFQFDISTNRSLSMLSFHQINAYLTFISPNSFQRLTKNSINCLLSLKNSNIKAFKLGNWQLPGFNTNVLSGLTALQSLSIEESKIEAITFSENLSDLQTLVLKSTSIKRIDSTISLLKELKSLKVLINNEILEFAPNMFKGLDQLECLHMCSCIDLGKIPMDMFNGLNNLVELNMSNCELKRIHSEAFSHTPKLTKLNLSSNKLKLKNTALLRHLPHLKELDLSNNKIEYSVIEKGLFCNLVSLETLSLNGNSIKILDSTIKLLKELKSLDLSNNFHLKASPYMFYGLCNLECLNLSEYKGLGEIDLDMLNGLNNLLELDMSHCDLIRIHLDAFSHTPKLTKLNLSHNNLKLEKIDALHNLMQLKELNLSNNRIEYFDIGKSMLANLVSLESLDLTNNLFFFDLNPEFHKLEFIFDELRKSAFENLKKLRNIKYSGNFN